MAAVYGTFTAPPTARCADLMTKRGKMGTRKPAYNPAMHSMRHTTGFIAIAAAIWTATCVPFVRKDDSIRVLVFNIHAGKDAGGKDNIADIGRLVRTSGATVALLQEVDRGTNRSGKVDQLQALRDATDYYPAFGKSLDYDGGQYGIGALARDGFIYNETVHLPVAPAQERAGGSHEPRVALLGVAVSPIGRLQTVNTHLDASGTDVYRLQETEGVLNVVLARLSPQTPVLVGGDFNSEPDSAIVRRLLDAGLRDAWTECGRGDGLTYPADRPTKRIDYVFLTGTLRCTAAEVLDTQISDHRPLLVTLGAPVKAEPAEVK
jgi:endonuclease/exonuclease/phosphatase family metal-dependent hydrolase